MKKIFQLIAISSLFLLLSGCAEEKEVLKTCTLTSNNTIQGYKMENEYKVYAKGDAALKVVTTEIVTSDNDEILDYLEEYINTTYTALDENYGGYEFDVKRENGKVIAETTIDYSKMDLKQYVKDNPVMKSYVNSDDELLVDGIINLYKSSGATCD